LFLVWILGRDFGLCFLLVRDEFFFACRFVASDTVGALASVVVSGLGDSGSGVTISSAVDSVCSSVTSVLSSATGVCAGVAMGVAVAVSVEQTGQ
jgi:hypothetical protein